MVSDLYTEEEFKEKIKEKKTGFSSLLDEEALAHLIVAEEGRNQEAIDDINDIKVGEECTVEGEVVDLGTLRTFENKNGRGRVRNVRIDDGTGSIKIVLWNDETDMVEEDLELGTKIRIANGYIQDKGYGKQISIGRWGEIKVVE